MQVLLDAGFQDACYASCNITEPSETFRCFVVIYSSWGNQLIYSCFSCQDLRCTATEPTLLDIEWPRLLDGARQVDVRLDYILVSRSVVEGMISVSPL